MIPTPAPRHDSVPRGAPRSGSVASTRGRAVRRLVTLGLVVAVAGCSLVSQVTGGDSEPAESPAPARETGGGGFYDYEELGTTAALDAAERALETGRPDDARRRAGEALERSSSPEARRHARLLLARAHTALGDTAAAREHIDGYRSSVDASDPLQTNVDVYRGEALLHAGRPVEALDAVLAVPHEAMPEDTRDWALRVVRRATEEVEPGALAALAQRAPETPVAAPVFVAHAAQLLDRGEQEASARLASSAIEIGAEGGDRAAARRILAAVGTSPEPELRPIEAARQEVLQSARYDPWIAAARALLLGRMVEGDIVLSEARSVGALLPESGSPTSRRFAQQVEEGVLAALAEAGAPELLELLVRDDAGSVQGAAAAVRAFDPERLLAVVGPLNDDQVVAAADARTTAVPIVSPTALSTGDRAGVYTLNGLDPGAAEALARYATGSGIEQVVVLHPDLEDRAFEAETFRERFVEAGGSVLRVLRYEAGTTYFEEQLETIRLLEPEALVLPIPAEDVPALAPQIRFYGLDTLGIRVLGTAGWTDETTLRELDARHANGVVAATPRPPEGELEGFRRLVEAYERRFQRSLVEPEVVALGYDAASLILQGLRLGARTPDQLGYALERTTGFPGATGVLTMQDGRLVREHWLVCVQNGALRSVQPGERPVAFRPERRGDPDEDEPETVPLGPLQLYCPGVPVPDGPTSPNF